MFKLTGSAESIQQFISNWSERPERSILENAIDVLEFDLNSTLNFTPLSPNFCRPIEEIEELILQPQPAEEYNNMIQQLKQQQQVPQQQQQVPQQQQQVPQQQQQVPQQQQQVPQQQQQVPQQQQQLPQQQQQQQLTQQQLPQQQQLQEQKQLQSHHKHVSPGKVPRKKFITKGETYSNENTNFQLQPAKKYDSIEQPLSQQQQLQQKKQLQQQKQFQQHHKHVSVGKVPRKKLIIKGKPYSYEKNKHKKDINNNKDSIIEISSLSENEDTSEKKLARDVDDEKTLGQVSTVKANRLKLTVPNCSVREKATSIIGIHGRGLATNTPSKFKHQNILSRPYEKSKKYNKKNLEKGGGELTYSNNGNSHKKEEISNHQSTNTRCESDKFSVHESLEKNKKIDDNKTSTYTNNISLHSHKRSGYVTDRSSSSNTSNKSRSLIEVNQKHIIPSRFVKMSTLYPEFNGENNTTWPITPDKIYITKTILNITSSSNRIMNLLAKPNVIISNIIKSVLRDIVIEYGLNKIKLICFDEILDNILKGMFVALDVSLSPDRNLNIENICKKIGKLEDIDYTKMNNKEIEKNKELLQVLQLCLELFHIEKKRNMCKININSIELWCQSLNSIVQQVVSDCCIVIAQNYIQNGKGTDEDSIDPEFVLQFLDKIEKNFINKYDSRLLRMLKMLYKMNEICTYLLFGIRITTHKNGPTTFTRELALQFLLANQYVEGFNVIGSENKLRKVVLCMPLAYSIRLGGFGRPADTRKLVQFVDDREDITGIMKFLNSARE